MSIDRINLLPQPPSLLSRVSLVAVVSSLYAVAMCALIVMTYLNYRESSTLDIEVATNSKRLSSLKAQTLALQSAAPADEDNLDISKLSAFSKRDLLVTDLLKELSLLAPQNLWLVSLNTKRLDTGGRTFHIVGEAISSQLVTQFLHTLEQSYFLRNARLKSSERVGTSDVYRFELEVKVAIRQFAKEGL